MTAPSRVMRSPSHARHAAAMQRQIGASGAFGHVDLPTEQRKNV